MSWIVERCLALTSRRSRAVLIVWVAVAIVFLPLAKEANSTLSNGGFVAPGSESARVERALPSFAKYNSDALVVVLTSPREENAQPILLAAMHRALSIIHTIPGAGVTRESLERAEEQAALLPAVALPINTANSEDVQDNLAVKLRRALHPGNRDRNGVTTYFLGQAALYASLDELSKNDLIKAESIGLPIVFVILLLMFGAWSAALLPALLGGAAVTISAGALYALSQLSPVSIFATNMASLLGVGVAVDYSLFMLARYQHERRAGADADRAMAVAIRTSGVAIVISGLTVLVSLAGLFLVNSTVVRSMAAAAVIVVLIAISGALTLTPVLMRRLGNRYAVGDRLWARLRRRFFPGRARPSGDPDAFWARWARGVMRRPVLSLCASIALLVVLAIPAFSMRVDDAALNQFPSSADVVRGTKALTDTFGPGITGPVQVVVSAKPHSAAMVRLRAEVQQVFARHGNLKRSRVEASRDGSQLLISAVPKVASDSEAEHRIVSDMRRELRAIPTDGGHVSLGGPIAQIQDYNHLVSGSLWKVAVFIALATFLLLVVLLRSVVLPAKAVLMTAFTVGASYGVLVVCFQWRWFDGLLGSSGPHYLGTLTPPFVLALTFGLSMDYQIFLLTRIREEYVAGADNATAVERGLARSARTISSAAVIMVAAFAVFAFISMPSIRELGIGLAVAIALDATIVRLVLVPAAMQLLGRWNWWLPGTSTPRPLIAEPQPAGD